MAARPGGRTPEAGTSASTASLFRLDGRVAIVTGGTRGIGLAAARALREQGARVAVASRSADACAAAVEALGGGDGVAGFATHVGSPPALARLVDEVLARFGRLDVLVNNAATSLDQPLGAVTEEAWAKVFDVNVRGPVLLAQLCAPHLAASDAASIVNVASVGAFVASSMAPMYGASKAALASMTRSMAATWAPDGIRANTLVPGGVDTDMVRRHPPAAAEALAQGCLQQRLATPEEMAGPVVFLASQASSFMTGEVLVVDGGSLVAP